MTDHLNQTIAQLRSGRPDNHAVADAALLLERASSKKTGLEDFDAVEVTSKQAENIKQGLLFALSCHPPMGACGAMLYALARTGDANLKNIYARELLSARNTMLESSSAMLQALLAIEALGEDIFPPNLASRGINDVEMNWRCAEAFLKRSAATKNN